eukprot:358969_1
MYRNFTQRYPYRSAMMTAGCLAFIGDFACQKIEKKYIHASHKHLKYWDYQRSLRFGFIAGCISPISQRWFHILTKRIFPGDGALPIALKRMLLHQSCAIPCYYCLFFCANTLLNGGSFNDVKQKLRNDFKSTYITNLYVWPAIHTITFWVIPWQYRILFNNIFTGFWNMFFSYMVNRPIEIKYKKKTNVKGVSCDV